MKANEAPEKLYIDFRDKAESTWRCAFTEKAKANDIEYTRTDAFIEKASEWLRNYLCDYFDDTGETYDMCIDEFIKAMKV